MLLHRLDEHLDARELDPAQALGELQVDLGREASGAPVRDTAGSVHGAEVAARGDVARAQVEFDAERLQHAPPDLIVERIVAEEPEMAGPAPRRDSRRNVADQPAGGFRRELGQIWKLRRLEFRASGLRAREPAEAVERDEDDLRRI